MGWLARIFGSKGAVEQGKIRLDSVDEEARNKLTPEDEERDREYFDLKMDPREWMAKYGHNIICWNPLKNVYQDKELESWVHKGYAALIDEGLEKLWAEFLTDEEIEVNRELYKNP